MRRRHGKRICPRGRVTVRTDGGTAATWRRKASDDWAERLWILGLTVATCVVAGAAYALIRRWQNKPDAAESEEAGHVS